ncbi:MAG: serine hydrolase [Chloroflexi bacterium]|nr:serine hydrolase [Chloroflexota bacterium]
MNHTTLSRDYWPTTGWRTASPDAHGMDAGQLAHAHEYMTTAFPSLTSLLVVRGGHLVFERYADGYGPDVLHNVKSATKSVTSLLTGVAILTGDLSGVDEPLGALLPTLLTGNDPRRDIRLADLLTMRSGLDWAEWKGTTLQMFASGNWLDFILDRPVAHPPGTFFNYSTGDTQLVAAIVQEVTGMSLLAYADLYLFTPLGIERRTWATDPQGINIGGAELSLTARGMAKLGFLALNNGRWDGTDILPATWVEAMTTRHTPAQADSAGSCDLSYGYLWWLRDQGSFASAMAVGYGGNYIYIVPDLDLVVAVTGDVKNVPKQFSDNRMLCDFNLVADYIVPAVG